MAARVSDGGVPPAAGPDRAGPVAVTRELIERLPKADLHVHLDGSLRPDTLIELGRESGTRLPTRDPGELAAYMCIPDARDLVEYLGRFETTLAVMQTAEAVERIAYELAEDAARENVRYMEVRFSPALNTRGGLSEREVVEASLRGLERAERERGIRTAVIICAIRNMSPDVSVSLAELAVSFRNRGVVAFDLAGAERDHPPAVHRAAFDIVAHASMAATVHAGEAFGPPSIREAIHHCHAKRIGHGVRLGEDAELEAFVNDFRIPLEMCPTSNVQTGAVGSLEDHPLRRFFDRGLVVTVNTDNRLMSGTSATEELWRVHRHLDFDWEELCDLVLLGFQSAFLPYGEKLALMAEVAREIEDLPIRPA